MRSSRRNVLLGLVCSIIASYHTAANASLPSGITPVMATWLFGLHALPSAVTTTDRDEIFRYPIGDTDWTRQAESKIKPGTRLPVVLYMHGCEGIRRQADQYRELLLNLGYGVFMPDSFRRPGRRACDQQGSLSQRVSMRLEEVAYALTKVRELSWVDQKRVVLMGFSEGGNTTDNWSKSGFAAHVILGSACTLVRGGAPAAPEGVPVLAIVGEYDEFRPGLSCRVTRTIGGSRSIVLPGARHLIAEHTETREAIRDFLRQCCSPSQ